MKNLDMFSLLFWGLVLLGASGSSATDPSRSSPHPQAQALLECYNYKSSWKAHIFEEFLTGSPGQLRLEKVLWSSKDGRGSGQSASSGIGGGGGGARELPPPLMSIVTAATPSRLDTLEAQCNSWPGRLVAALYLPLRHSNGQASLGEEAKQQLKAVEADVEALFKRTESAPSACALRLMLLTELVGDTLLGALLPINALRSAAMLGADTPLVAMIDVDLLPSASLAQEVLLDTQKGAALQAACKQKQVFVLPAFETHKKVELQRGWQLAQKLVSGPKSDLVSLMEGSPEQQLLVPFASLVYARGHNATDYAKWYHSFQPYKIEYQINYEPWYIVDRFASPGYDSRFRGYGWNKVQQVALANATGFTFMVHPSAFLVHRPHGKSAAQGIYNTAGGVQAEGGSGAGASSSKQRGGGRGAMRETRNGVPVSKLFHRRVGTLRHVTIRDMNRGIYRPLETQESVHCRATLPWWQERKA